ncbi:CHRD domain-containing protein [Dietzia sp. PP-33]|uniref:CHRD domain-containing protein n=1 Tax=Dietzia sp. PP-33 TaxID=2957500 RepID=UPI00299FCE12|nr:CHRD domain-containing protein [Dietzia sp. PP-33]MDX2355953.1 CHRD domain-containing protein [Dietzia sp. PP-33]
MTRRTLPVLAATALFSSLGVAPAMAGSLGSTGTDTDTTNLTANITELNDSGVESTAWLTLDGNELSVRIDSSGLLAGAPHAQHIHIGGANQCPDPNQEGTGFEGAIRTTDAIDSYGGVQVSLTTEGDTSPASALAVERFPVGDAAYSRTFTVTDEVAASLRNGEGSVVLHGVDHNGSGEYDGEQVSDLNPDLPSEATDPAACGELNIDSMGSLSMGSLGGSFGSMGSTGSTGSLGSLGS